MRLVGYLKLTRPFNLLVIAFTMWVSYTVVAGTHTRISSIYGDYPVGLWLAMLAMVLIAASGNVYNDIVDTTADRYKQGKNLVVGTVVSERSAKVFFWGLSIAGWVSALIAALLDGGWLIVVLAFTSSVFLLSYSKRLQYLAVAGNVVVAGLLALVPLESIAFIPEGLLARLVLSGVSGSWLLYLIMFAFLTNLLRELVKDIEDFESDRAVGSRNLVQVISPEKGRWVAAILAMVIAGSMLLAPSLLPVLQETVVEVSLTLLASAMVLVSAMLTGAVTSRSLSISSAILKMIMIFGVIIPLLALS